jgi:hypothetical protein
LAQLRKSQGNGGAAVGLRHLACLLFSRTKIAGVIGVEREVVAEQRSVGKKLYRQAHFLLGSLEVSQHR